MSKWLIIILLLQMYLVVGDLVFSYGASLVLALLVESPCTRLLSLLASGMSPGPCYFQQTLPKNFVCHSVVEYRQIANGEKETVALIFAFFVPAGKLSRRSQAPRPEAPTSVKEAPKRPTNTQELVRATLAPTFSCVRYRNL